MAGYLPRLRGFATAGFLAAAAGTTPTLVQADGLSIGPGETFEGDGSMVINNIGKGADVTITGGDLTIEGTIHDGATVRVIDPDQETRHKYKPQRYSLFANEVGHDVTLVAPATIELKQAGDNLDADTQGYFQGTALGESAEVDAVSINVREAGDDGQFTAERQFYGYDMGDNSYVDAPKIQIGTVGYGSTVIEGDTMRLETVEDCVAIIPKEDLTRAQETDRVAEKLGAEPEAVASLRPSIPGCP